jgi:hypothetical protein
MTIFSYLNKLFEKKSKVEIVNIKNSCVPVVPVTPIVVLTPEEIAMQDRLAALERSRNRRAQRYSQGSCSSPSYRSSNSDDGFGVSALFVGAAILSSNSD